MDLFGALSHRVRVTQHSHIGESLSTKLSGGNEGAVVHALRQHDSLPGCFDLRLQFFEQVLSQASLPNRSSVGAKVAVMRDTWPAFSCNDHSDAFAMVGYSITLLGGRRVLFLLSRMVVC